MAELDDVREPVSLTSLKNSNWRHNVRPAAVLNDAASMHDKAAYCWGVVSSYRQLASLLLQSKDEEVSVLADMFWQDSAPLDTMLELLGAETAKAEREKETQHAQ